jgi:hypothetical protein
MKFTAAEILQLLVPIIGLIVAIINLITAIKRRYSESRVIPNESTSGGKRIGKKRNKKSYRKLVIALIIIIISIPGINIAYKKFFIEPIIKIGYPVNNQKVNDVETIEGTFRNITQNNQLIWVAIYSYVDNKYFLYESAKIDYVHKKWGNNQLTIGTQSDTGKQFNIIVLLVDYKSKQYDDIINYLNDTNKHGLDNLPLGSHIYNEIKVFIK